MYGISPASGMIYWFPEGPQMTWRLSLFLPELPPHFGMPGTELVSRVVDPEEVPDEHVPLLVQAATLGAAVHEVVEVPADAEKN